MAPLSNLYRQPVGSVQELLQRHAGAQHQLRSRLPGVLAGKANSTGASKSAPLAERVAANVPHYGSTEAAADQFEAMRGRLAAVAAERSAAQKRKRRGDGFSAAQLAEGVRELFGGGKRRKQRASTDPVEKGSDITLGDLERELLLTDMAYAAQRGVQPPLEPEP